jgi:hypothetical protein
MRVLVYIASKRKPGNNWVAAGSKDFRLDTTNILQQHVDGGKLVV